MLGAIRSGMVFVYPTDTVYGLGCDARNAKAVARLRRIKRKAGPLSVIAPSKAWIAENCVVGKEAEAFLKKMPGPFTAILALKKRNAVAKNVCGCTTHASACVKQTLGVRIPKHWVSAVVRASGTPVVTTSANVSGGKAMKKLKDLDVRLRKEADLIFFDGACKNKPSQIVDFSGAKPRRLR
ncbi:Threonylcarbamoyl-AMP synthase [Candidatus Norongarragalina meridionalis]|nr:Threonylcarbamoyl-AMP synthase [Candidatus Norongarragalina meridionalis]